MRVVDGQPRIAEAADGEVRYHAVGDGPAILFINGLGASQRAFDSQVEHLADRYRCLLWDYRGLFRDGTTPPAAGTVADHARDGLAILDAEGIERAALIGWSFGVPVALSIFEQAAGRVALQVLVSGGARAAWGRSPEAGPLRRLFPRVFDLVERAPRLLEMLIGAGGASPEAFTWARRVGLVGPELEQDLFAEVVSDLARIDVEALVAMLRTMGDEDQSAVLPRVDVPTLVIGGDRDPFVSRAALERLVNHIAGAEYLLLPGATHYAVLDRAQHVNLRIEKFFSERGYVAQTS